MVPAGGSYHDFCISLYCAWASACCVCLTSMRRETMTSPDRAAGGGGSGTSDIVDGASLLSLLSTMFSSLSLTVPMICVMLNGSLRFLPFLLLLPWAPLDAESGMEPSWWPSLPALALLCDCPFPVQNVRRNNGAHIGAWPTTMATKSSRIDHDAETPARFS